jgi:AraC-like DNA-binding protein
MSIAADHDRISVNLVNAAQRFLIEVLPIRHPESELALQWFCKSADVSATHRSETELVLIRCLNSLSQVAWHILPSLVDLYFEATDHSTDPIARFATCVRGLLRSQTSSNATIRRALAIIETRYAEPALTEAEVASMVGVRASSLAVALKAQTGLSFNDLRRERRLAHAAHLLANTELRVKETAVGYNDPSNFNHDFKKKFGMSPREYRAKVSSVHGQDCDRIAAARPAHRGIESRTGLHCVLVVGTDVDLRVSVSRFLEQNGHNVVSADTKEAALAQAKRTRLSGIVLDHPMKDGDVLECLRVIRNECGENILTVILTADWCLFERSGHIPPPTTIAYKPCALTQIGPLIRSGTGSP